MRRTTIGVCLAAAFAGYAAGQWQLADSRSIAQDAAAPPPAAAAPAVEQPAESDLERKYVEKSRQLFRTLSPEQQQHALENLDFHVRQAEAMAEIKRVQQELKAIAEKYAGTTGASLATEAERVLQQQTVAGPAPVFVPFSFAPPIPVAEPITIPPRNGDRLGPAPDFGRDNAPQNSTRVPVPDNGFTPRLSPGTGTERKAKTAS